MKKLVCGIQVFQEQVYKPMSEFFRGLANGQHPRAIFVTCSDSRINPDLITQAEPGDLFMIRNAGNLIPAQGTIMGGTAASLEYGVSVLGIRNIIVCGHSRCGAMNSLLHPETLMEFPTIYQWLKNAEATRRIARDLIQNLDLEQALEITAQANVLVQIDNLKTHPCVAAGTARGELSLHAWYYRFETGEVFAFHPARGQYISFSEATPVAVVPSGQSIDYYPSKPGSPFGAWITECAQLRIERSYRHSLTGQPVRESNGSV